MCAAAVNSAAFLKDCSDALSVPKNTEFSTSEDSSMSLVWICTGTSDLTKVSVTYRGHVMYMYCMYMYDSQSWGQDFLNLTVYQSGSMEFAFKNDSLLHHTNLLA